MQLSQVLATSLLSLTVVGMGLPVLAAPELASGDLSLPTDVEGCLSRADSFIAGLDVRTNVGEISRSGYFGDGAFRLICYPNPYADEAGSMLVVFAVHDSDQSVAATFVQFALEQMDVQD